MNTSQRKILMAIFTDPVSPTIAWRDIESLFKACGGVIKEGRGSPRLVYDGEGRGYVPPPASATGYG